jgi:hypothetical protein
MPIPSSARAPSAYPRRLGHRNLSSSPSSSATTAPDRDLSNNTAVATWAWNCSAPVVNTPTGADQTGSASGVDFYAVAMAMLAAGLTLIVFSLALAFFERRRPAA